MVSERVFCAGSSWTSCRRVIMEPSGDAWLRWSSLGTWSTRWCSRAEASERWPGVTEWPRVVFRCNCSATGQGFDAFSRQSRRAHTKRKRTCGEVEDEIIVLRKHLLDGEFNARARTIPLAPLQPPFRCPVGLDHLAEPGTPQGNPGPSRRLRCRGLKRSLGIHDLV